MKFIKLVSLILLFVTTLIFGDCCMLDKCNYKLATKTCTLNNQKVSVGLTLTNNAVTQEIQVTDYLNQRCPKCQHSIYTHICDSHGNRVTPYPAFNSGNCPQ